MYGFYGIADSINNAPSILWFDENMNFIKGEILKKCVNCEHCERSGGGFFTECMFKGFQINDSFEKWCENFTFSESIKIHLGK